MSDKPNTWRCDGCEHVYTTQGPDGDVYYCRKFPPNPMLTSQSWYGFPEVHGGVYCSFYEKQEV